MGNTPTISPHPDRGLSHAEAEMRRNAGLSAGAPKAAGRTKWEIVLHHSFTFFNLVFVILAVLLLLGGSSVKNMGFLPVAACNTLIGIFQELKSKRTIDKMTLLSVHRYTVIRETAPKLSIAVETLRRWVEQAEVDIGKKPGVPTDAQEQIRKLKRGTRS